MRLRVPSWQHGSLGSPDPAPDTMPLRRLTLAERAAPTRYATASAVFLAALALRFAVLPVDQRAGFITFYPAIVLVFYLCGTGPGLWVLVLSAVCGLYIFYPPYWGWALTPTSALVALSFVGSSLIIALVMRTLQNGHRRLGEALARMELSDARWKAMVNDQSDVVLRFDARGAVLFANDTAQRLFGEAARPGRPGRWRRAVHPEDLARVLDRLATLSPAKPSVRFDCRVLDVDGEVHWIDFVDHAFHDSARRLLEVQSVGREVTELTEARQALEGVVREQHAMLHSDLVGIIKIRRRDTVWANSAFERMFGYEPGELLGKSSRILYPDAESYLALGRDAYKVLQAGGTYRAQARMVKKSGDTVWVDISGTMLTAQRDESLCMMLDITALKMREQRIEALAYHDALTGLPNRALLLQLLERELATRRRLNNELAVCFVDLDRFKPINDAHGHDAGDRVLEVVAERLQESVRGNDIVARLGGDEFVVVLTHLPDAVVVRDTLGRLLERLRAPIALPDGAVAVISASVGVAVCPGDAQGTQGLLRRADQAMYEAKGAGRDQLRFYAR